MKTMLVETYKIKSKDLVSKHDKIFDELLIYVLDNAKSKGWKIPPHKMYSVQGEELGRMFMVYFDDIEHQNEWMGNVVDDKFKEYDAKIQTMIENFKPTMITNTKTF
jgi:hypothetical protein